MAKTGEGLTHAVNLPPAEEMDMRQFLRCNGYTSIVRGIRAVAKQKGDGLDVMCVSGPSGANGMKSVQEIVRTSGTAKSAWPGADRQKRHSLW
jgi:hypothetical protein